MTPLGGMVEGFQNASPAGQIAMGAAGALGVAAAGAVATGYAGKAYTSYKNKTAAKKPGTTGSTRGFNYASPDGSGLQTSQYLPTRSTAPVQTVDEMMMSQNFPPPPPMTNVLNESQYTPLYEPQYNKTPRYNFPAGGDQDQIMQQQQMQQQQMQQPQMQQPQTFEQGFNVQQPAQPQQPYYLTTSNVGGGSGCNCGCSCSGKTDNRQTLTCANGMTVKCPYSCAEKCAYKQQKYQAYQNCKAAGCFKSYRRKTYKKRRTTTKKRRSTRSRY